jgi:hypothetical protein
MSKSLFVGYIKEMPNIVQIEGNTLLSVLNELSCQLIYLFEEREDLEAIKIHTEIAIRVIRIPSDLALLK